MLRSPLQRLKNEHVECSLQQLNPVLVLAFFVHRCRHSTAMEVDCLLPLHGGASIQSRAYSNSSDEIGIRPDISVEAVAVCPAEPRGRRGGCEPAGKTCY